MTEREKLQLKRRVDYYQRKLSRYKTWLSKAAQLLEASKIIEAKIKNDFDALKNSGTAEKTGRLPFGLLEIHSLLVGFAIENSLKAKWVKINCRGSKNEMLTHSKLPKEIHGHNLLLLAGKVGLKLSADECEWLNRLSEYLKWAARYPVPVEAKDLKPRLLSGSDLSKSNNLVFALNQRLWRKQLL